MMVVMVGEHRSTILGQIELRQTSRSVSSPEMHGPETRSRGEDETANLKPVSVSGQLGPITKVRGEDPDGMDRGTVAVLDFTTMRALGPKTSVRGEDVVGLGSDAYQRDLS